MNSLLLDTNVLIWFIYGEPMSKRIKNLIAETPMVYVSALSLLEIKIKQEIEKLPFIDIEKALLITDIKVLNLDSSQVLSYKLYDKTNKDPFNNAITTVAISKNLALVTSDKKILSLHEKNLRTIDATK